MKQVLSKRAIHILMQKFLHICFCSQPFNCCHHERIERWINNTDHKNINYCCSTYLRHNYIIHICAVLVKSTKFIRNCVVLQSEFKVCSTLNSEWKQSNLAMIRLSQIEAETHFMHSYFN